MLRKAAAAASSSPAKSDGQHQKWSVDDGSSSKTVVHKKKKENVDDTDNKAAKVQRRSNRKLHTIYMCLGVAFSVFALSMILFRYKDNNLLSSRESGGLGKLRRTRLGGDPGMDADASHRRKIQTADQGDDDAHADARDEADAATDDGNDNGDEQDEDEVDEEEDEDGAEEDDPILHNKLHARQLDTNFLPPNSVYKLQVEDIHGEMVQMSKFQAVLQERYRNRGFSVVAFPISDFNQELGSNEEIEAFVKENFPQVDFPIMGLSSLDESPVFRLLQGQVDREERVRWNFFKYLVDGNGQVSKVFDQRVNPLALADDIESLLEEAIGRGGHKLVTE